MNNRVKVRFTLETPEPKNLIQPAGLNFEFPYSGTNLMLIGGNFNHVSLITKTKRNGESISLLRANQAGASEANVFSLSKAAVKAMVVQFGAVRNNRNTDQIRFPGFEFTSKVDPYLVMLPKEFYTATENAADGDEFSIAIRMDENIRSHVTIHHNQQVLISDYTESDASHSKMRATYPNSNPVRDNSGEEKSQMSYHQMINRLGKATANPNVKLVSLDTMTPEEALAIRDNVEQRSQILANPDPAKKKLMWGKIEALAAMAEKAKQASSAQSAASSSPPVAPHQALLNEFKGEDNIVAAINEKNYGQALRLICLAGRTKLIEKFVPHQQKLNIDVNEVIDNKTALDLLEQANIDRVSKNKAKTLLMERCGAQAASALQKANIGLRR
jgi:hypothetical protein